jgi:ABC-type glycerol-3-phosphate transport system substrate-binding protein
MVQAGDRFSTAPAATRRRYAVSLVTLAAGAGAALAACGAPPAGAPRSGGKTGTVQVWTAYPVNAPNIKVLSDMVAPTFKAANPAANVEITSIPAAQFMEKLTAVRSSKDAPDFTWANQFVGTLALYDWIYPMDTYYRQIGVRTDDFYGVVERQYRFNGRWWIYPHYSGIKAYVYRTDFFAEAGLRQFPTTWEEFADAARRLTKRNAAGEISRSGHSQSKAVDWEELLSWGRQNGALEFEEKDPLQGKATVNAPAFVEAFTAFLDLRRRHQVAPVDGNPPGQGIIGDNVAIARQGPWWLPSMRATNPQNADKLAVAPPLKRKQHSDWGFADGFYMYKTQNGPDLGVEFLKAFHQDENYLAYCDPPDLPGAAGAVQRYPSARKSINAKMAWLKTEPLMKEWMTWMDWGWAGMQMHLEYGQILKEAFLPATAQALEGTASDRPVLDEAAKVANAITDRAVADIKKR